MNVAAWLEKCGRSYADRPAIARGTSLHLSFGAWAARTRRIAAQLLGGLGCRAGDRVAITMTNCPEFLEAEFAIWHAGLVAVPSISLRSGRMTLLGCSIHQAPPADPKGRY